MTSANEQLGVIFKTIRILFRIFGMKSEQAYNYVKDKVGPKLNIYKRILSWLLLIGVISLVAFLISVVSGIRIAISLSGAIVIISTLTLLVLGAPIGILVECLWGGVKGSASKYAAFFKSVAIVQLCCLLFAWLIPFHNKPEWIFPFVIAALILGLMGSHIFRKAVIVFIASVILLFLLRGFFFPQSSSGILDLIPWIDKKASDYLTRVSVHSNPTGASVYAGLDYKGNTPRVQLSRHELAQGVLILLSGHKPIIVDGSGIEKDILKVKLERGTLEKTGKSLLINEARLNGVNSILQNLGFTIDEDESSRDLYRQACKSKLSKRVMYAWLNQASGIDSVIEIKEKVIRLADISNFGYDDIGKSFSGTNIARRTHIIKTTDFLTGTVQVIEHEP